MLPLLILTSGCIGALGETGSFEIVWGRRGISDGRFQKPRAITADGEGRIYVVDMTARVQVFTPEGEFLRGWSTPTHEMGRPTGLGVDRRGRLLVADTHYHRVLVYSPEGELVQILGGTAGTGPGEFGLVTDAVQDSQGNYYVSEYGEYDRIQKFDPDGNFLLQWGGHGTELGQFMRPQGMEIDEQDRIWVTDSCNHRIQVFDGEGNVLQCWGEQGQQPGQLYYPYGLVLDDQGHVYVCEYGNHRVQKFRRDGTSLGCWGTGGRREGELHNPWGLTLDRQGRIHIVDANNHRIQRIRL